MTHKIALITGITGQDGAYLSDFLLDKNYRVIGVQQPSATPNTQNIDPLIQHPNFELIICDITDANAIFEILKTTNPDEIYNLAGQSHVGLSFNLPDYTTQVNAIGTLRLLEAIRILELKNTRFYQASTSEIFGNADHSPQNENTP
jgi:GDPmannose 4,6-dehydratase